MAATNYRLVVFFADYPKAICRGEIALNSGHLVNFHFDNLSGKFLGTVQASQRNKNYKVEVDLNDDGTVFAARCECARGLYKCHHMGAVLLHGIKSVSSTDMPCSWNRQKPIDSVREVDEMFPHSRPFNPLKRQPTQEDRNFFRAKLKLDGVTCGMRWLLAPEPKSAQLPAPTVDNILGSQELIQSSDQSGCFLKMIEVTPEQIVAVEQETRGQSNNPLWGMYRKGQITASNFGLVIANLDSGRQPSMSLMKTLLGEYDLSGQKAIQYGIHHEQEAIKTYEQVCGNKVIDTGLFLHRSGLLGASPDGVISHSQTNLIEVKCPLSAQDMTIDEAIDTIKNFFITRNQQGARALAMNAKGKQYWHQIQGQLALAGREECHFVVWTSKDLAIIPVHRDPSWAANNIHRLMDFHVHHILPRLISDQ